MAQMPIPQDWDGTSWCCWVVEWPSSPDWEAILLGFITTPMRGRFWDETTGSVIDAQEIGQQITARNNVTVEGCSMGCLEDLTAAINALKEVFQGGILVNGGCGCNGSGGAGVFEDAPSSFVDNGTAFPSGYDDRSDYLDSKCQLAQYVIDGLVSGLKNLRQVDVTQYALGALVALFPLLFILPIAYLALVATAESILGLVAIGAAAFTTAVNELIEFLQDDFDICRLYDAGSAQEAKDNIIADINAAAFSQDTLTKNLLINLISFDSLNLLFDAKPALDFSQLPVADCSGCSGPEDCGYTVAVGTGPEFPGGEFTSAIGPTGFGRIQLAPASSFCPTQAVTFTLVSVSSEFVTHISINYVDENLGPVTNSYTVASLMAGITFNAVSWDDVGVDWFMAEENAGGRSFVADITFAIAP